MRAFGYVGGDPLFVERGEGPFLITEDGRQLVDFICSWGALILGHAHPDVVAAVEGAARRGTSFGLPTAAETELAETITRLVPAVEMVRLVNSGTEATAAAVRLARAATGRPAIVKFAGCYHGHADGFLVKAGSGAATLGSPDSPGVPAGTAADTRIARFNDLESVRAVIDDEVAAVIVEPVAGNMGLVIPRDGFLQGLRELCDQAGALLIFDEVMTGFRVALGGAQALYGVLPDITTLGKVVGGGMPAAAYGGSRELMSMMAPEGPVYQAGTLAGNPLAVAAGLVTLAILEAEPEIYTELDGAGGTIQARLRETLERVGLPGVVNQVGGMFGIFLGIEEATDWESVSQLNRDLFTGFFQRALEGGVLLAPSPFEAAFLMRAHLGPSLEQAIEVMEAALEAVAA